MNEFIEKNSPPGMNTKAEKTFFVSYCILYFTFKLFSFATEYIRARSFLYERVNGKWVLRENALIADFGETVFFNYKAFALFCLVLLGFVLYRYIYYRQGSMSIYLMKRLPQKNEIHVRAIKIPLIMLVLGALFILLTFLLFFASYVVFTPKVCLPDGLWQSFWRIFYA